MAGFGGLGSYSQATPGGAVGPGGLFDRISQRPEPRFGISLAGVGMVMILIGVLTWAGEQAVEGVAERGEDNPTLGIVLSLAVIALGYVLLVRYRGGPLATVGVVGATLGVPMLLGFATFDSEAAEDTDVILALPFSVDAVAVVSLVVWLVTVFALPAARGRAFYLAASSLVLWLYVLEKVEEGALGYVVTLPFSLVFFPINDTFGTGPVPPDPSTVGGVTFVFGLGYYVTALMLDRQGRRGLATPFTVTGLVTVALGLAHLAGDLNAVGTGLVLVALGTGLSVYGATNGRRFTTWTWAAGIGLGVLVILSDAFEDNVSGFGISAIVLGTIVALAGHLVKARFAEPDELAPGPSRFLAPQAAQHTAPWAAYPGSSGYQPPPGAIPFPAAPTQTEPSPWAPPAPPAPPPPPPPPPSAE